MAGPKLAKATTAAGATDRSAVQANVRRASTNQIGAVRSLGRTMAQALGQTMTSKTVSRLSDTFWAAATRAVATMRCARSARKICTKPAGMNR